MVELLVPQPSMDVRQQGRTDGGAETADHVHQAGQSAGAASTHVGTDGPDDRHRQVIDQEAQTQQDFRLPYYGRETRGQDAHSSQEVAGDANEGTAPAPAESAAQHEIGPSTAQQCADGAAKEGSAGQPPGVSVRVAVDLFPILRLPGSVEIP